MKPQERPWVLDGLAAFLSERIWGFWPQTPPKTCDYNAKYMQRDFRKCI